jgi:hypothetical protein
VGRQTTAAASTMAVALGSGSNVALLPFAGPFRRQRRAPKPSAVPSCWNYRQKPPLAETWQLWPLVIRRGIVIAVIPKEANVAVEMSY